MTKQFMRIFAIVSLLSILISNAAMAEIIVYKISGSQKGHENGSDFKESFKDKIKGNLVLDVVLDDSNKIESIVSAWIVIRTKGSFKEQDGTNQDSGRFEEVTAEELTIGDDLVFVYTDGVPKSYFGLSVSENAGPSNIRHIIDVFGSRKLKTIKEGEAQFSVELATSLKGKRTYARPMEGVDGAGEVGELKISLRLDNKSNKFALENPGLTAEGAAGLLFCEFVDDGTEVDDDSDLRPEICVSE